jgi:cleavage and polyadenylation specificity factor subunit 1
LQVPHLVPEMLDREMREGAYAPQSLQFSIDLISSDHDFTLSDSFLFEEYEHILCVHHALLDSKQASSGKRNFLIVGTAYIKGEDVSTRGRIHILETIRVVPEPGRPETCWKLKPQCVEEIKSPVSALSSLNGHLIVAMGAKVLVYDYEEEDDGERALIGIAFHDAQIYVSHMSIIKNFIAVGDLYKSVQLLVMQEDPPKLHLLGKDHHALPVAALDVLVNGSIAGFLAADEIGALHLLMYAPHNMLSFGGTKLLRRADMFIGSLITKLIRFRMRTPSNQNSSWVNSAQPQTVSKGGNTITGLPHRPGQPPIKGDGHLSRSSLLSDQAHTFSNSDTSSALIGNWFST